MAIRRLRRPRLIGGAWIGLATSAAAFLGPLSLRLGVAVTQVPG